MCDVIEEMLSEVCRDVKTETIMVISASGEIFHNKTTNTDDEARVDVSARGIKVDLH